MWFEFEDQAEIWPGVTLKAIEVGKEYGRYIGMGRNTQVVSDAWVVQYPVPSVAYVVSGTQVEMVPFTALRRYRLGVAQ